MLDLDGVAVGFIVTSCDPQTGMGMIEIVAVDSFGNVSPAKTVKVKRQ